MFINFVRIVLEISYRQGRSLTFVKFDWFCRTRINATPTGKAIWSDSVLL